MAFLFDVDLHTFHTNSRIFVDFYAFTAQQTAGFAGIFALVWIHRMKSLALLGFYSFRCAESLELTERQCASLSLNRHPKTPKNEKANHVV